MVNVFECTGRPILEPCGLKDLNYQVDTYIGCAHCCHYCYALADAETDWSREIGTHRGLIDRLGVEIDAIPPQTIYMGYHTDPYQPCETEYRQTRNVLELFLQKGFSASILTKSDLVTRDMDILKKMKTPAVSVSVAFNDNQTRRLFEANTMDTEKRIEALRQLKAAGIQTGALLCPVVPYITDAIGLLDMLRPHADVIWIYGLSIRDRSAPSWSNIQPILKRHYPQSIDRITAAIFSRDHDYWIQLRESLVEAKKRDRRLKLYVHV